MTERPARGRIRVPGPLPVVAAALALFLVVLSLLAFQLRAQARPAAIAADRTPATAPVRRILERRVVITKVIVRVLRDDGQAAPAPATRVVQTSAPVTAPAAVPPPAAAPAPAPAPLTTRTS